jgi:molybdate transport system substrate-binding protein
MSFTRALRVLVARFGQHATIVPGARPTGTAASSLLTAVMVAALLTASAAVAHAQELTFSVAISMKEAVETLGRQFVQARPGVTLRYNFGASGDLAKQIEAGAPVDLFISAAQRQMDELEAKHLVISATRRTFARNVLTVVTAADSRVVVSAADALLAPGVGRIVVGDPRSVPAGQYAEESLRALGIWSALRPKLVFAENVRQALEYVARGEVDAGVVYATDAATARGRVKEAFRLPESSYRPVLYPAAVVKDSRHSALARAFVELLTGAEGQAALGRLGFQPPPASTR